MLSLSEKKIKKLACLRVWKNICTKFTSGKRISAQSRQEGQ